MFVQIGQTIGRAAYSSDLLASFVVSGPNRRLVERRLRRLETWFLNGLLVDEPLARAAS